MYSTLNLFFPIIPSKMVCIYFSNVVLMHWVNDRVNDRVIVNDRVNDRVIANEL